MHRQTFTQRNFYAQQYLQRNLDTVELLHAGTLTHIRLHTQKPTHTHRPFTETFAQSFCEQKLLDIDALTHTNRIFFTHSLLHRETLPHSTEVFAHRRHYTQKHLHRETFTRRKFFTEERLHRGTFTQSSLHTYAFYTEGHLHREGLAQKNLYAETFAQRNHAKFLHREDFTWKLSRRKAFTQRNLSAEKFLRTEAFTHGNLYTQTILHTHTHRYKQKPSHTDHQSPRPFPAVQPSAELSMARLPTHFHSHHRPSNRPHSFGCSPPPTPSRPHHCPQNRPHKFLAAPHASEQTKQEPKH